MLLNLKKDKKRTMIYNDKNEVKSLPPVGFEPTTFGWY